MAELHELIGEDSRTPIHRLRRRELFMLCKAHRLPIPDGATKDNMVLMLQGAQVDIMKPISGLKWKKVSMEYAPGKFKDEMIVDRPKHYTSDLQIDYESQIEKISKQSNEVSKENISLKLKLETMEKQIADLSKLLVSGEARSNVENQDFSDPEITDIKPIDKPDFTLMSYNDLRKYASDNGIIIDNKIKKDELAVLLNNV